MAEMKFLQSACTFSAVRNIEGLSRSMNVLIR